jgi:UDP-N-acetylglucosamine acyltransferase
VGVNIHPTAIVDSAAKLGTDVAIGPYSVVEANVEIGDRTVIGCHTVVAWGTRMGAGCRIFNGVSVGTIPQDLKYAGEETTMEIGNNTIIREFSTLNRGTIAAGKTVVGNNCALLAYSHIAHDCIVGNNVIASNNLTLAGHVTVCDYVTFGGYVAIHQFCRVGEFAFIQSGCRVLRDVLPFAICGGDTDNPHLAGINKVGLERRGYDEERRTKIKRIMKKLFSGELSVAQTLPALLEQYPGDSDVMAIVEFVKTSQRGIYRLDN